MGQQFKQNNYFILTGAMGAGKSTLLQELMALKQSCIEEPARPIIAEQRSIDGDGIYDRDTKLFIELMLSRAIFQFKQMQNYRGPIIFDRGIPDMMGYANSAGLELAHVLKASNTYRYGDLVFYAPGWKEIYTTDDERKMSYEAARQFGEDVKKVYLNLGYEVIDLPFDTPKNRARFVIDAVSARMKSGE